MMAILGCMVLFFLSGLLNLLLGRERLVPARLDHWEVHVGSRRNTVTSFFQAQTHNYTWESAKVAPVDQSKPVDLVVDGLFWDEIVEIHQEGKVVWKRI